ncbi:MAG: hypothetical protein IJ242_02435 [Clostridia bacterium]|nr:hypothetical protein [Clostridia bacterium]
MIQLTVTDTLQNFTNNYIFQTQDDMVSALNMLFDFADYSEESIKNEVLQLHVRSDRPLDTGKSYYHFKKERMSCHETGN